MKKLLFSIVLAGMLSGACGNKKAKERELEMQRARQATIDSVNMANREKQYMDSMAAMESAAKPDAVVIESPKMPDEKAPHTKKGGTKKTPAPAPNPTPVPEKDKQPGVVTGTSTENQPETAENSTLTPEEKKKKGLNNAAKGAIIGLGTGAAAGAVINKKNRAKGAVVGGVIGAIGGAVGGAVIDKQKQKKAEKDTVKTTEEKK